MLGRFVLRYPRPVGAVILAFGALFLEALIFRPVREGVTPLRVSFRAIAFAALFVAAGSTTLILGRSAARLLVEKDGDPGSNVWTWGCFAIVFVGVLGYMWAQGYGLER